MENKIHILFGIPSLSVGGIEKQLIKQLELFDRNKFKISLITLFDYKDIPTLYDKVPKDIEVYKLNWKGKFDLNGVTKLKDLLSSLKPDIVVTSMFSANTIFRMVNKGNYISIPREHNIYHEKKWWQKIIDKSLASKSFTIVSVSKTVADFAAKQAGIDRWQFSVIHNGVEIEKINKFISENQIQKENIILNVGRLKKQKNQKLLIESFAKIKDQIPDWKLVIVGRGPEEENLKNLIKDLGIENQVKLAGYSDNVYEYYSKAKVFALTSKHEGFPNVAIEAMAFGLPLISTLLPGVDEFLENKKNGFLIEDNVDSISNTILDVAKMSQEDYSYISENAKDTASKFDIRENVRKYEELFEEAVYEE